MVLAEVVIDLNVELLPVVVGGSSEGVPQRLRSSQPAEARRVQTIHWRECRVAGSKKIRMWHVLDRACEDNACRIDHGTVGIPRCRSTGWKQGGTARTILRCVKRNHAAVGVESL